jgi:hypothetical protein
MTPHEFVRKWKDHNLSERSAAQSHFIDLCKLLDHPAPTDADRDGTNYTFEKGVSKTGGGDGFADAWKRGFFAWEYKKRRRNLDAALEQLTRYASALENPPLHVACDTERFRIVTAWTNTVPKTYSISIEDLLDAEKITILHHVFHDPERLKPQRTRAQLTKEAADRFSTIATALQQRHPDKEAVAHFINQLVFCFFAEDVKVLPEGYFTKLLRTASSRPETTTRMLNDLFAAMASGGPHGVEDIRHFNGGLFDNQPALGLEQNEINALVKLGEEKWDQIDPTIFGTLFERFLDPDKRAQIGAHYTDAEKIMMIIDPVLVRPLLAEWEDAKANIRPIADKLAAVTPKSQSRGERKASDRAAQRLRSQAEAIRDQFLDRLRGVRILDPACGSGNFLYLALHALKDIENRIVLECEGMGLNNTPLYVGPENVMGIEINPLAAELARTTIWIGYIQWKIRNGIWAWDNPVLRKLNNIECRDALIASVPPTGGDAGEPETVMAEWPAAEFIVGNPPFLGGKLFRKGRPANRTNAAVPGLGDETTDTLFKVYKGEVPASCDLVAYWFYKAAEEARRGATRAFGFVATKSLVRGNSGRFLAEQMNRAGLEIRAAWTNEQWVIDGAQVRVSLICYDQIASGSRQLNGQTVDRVEHDLTEASLLLKAKLQPANKRIAFQGVKLNGPFQIDSDLARSMIAEPLNPNGLPNSRVIKRFFGNDDITQRDRDEWVIDFTEFPDGNEASLFTTPFEYTKKMVLDSRSSRGTGAATETDRLKSFWLMQRPRPTLRKAIQNLEWCVVVPETSEHLLFKITSTSQVFSGSVFVIASDRMDVFGVLESRFHKAWARNIGNRLGAGNQSRYNATFTFETYPFPEGMTPDLRSLDVNNPSSDAVASVARELNEMRFSWLNPRDLVEIMPEVSAEYPDRICPVSEEAAQKLKRRTLTELYNQWPQWLAELHDRLDRSVAAAYGWPEDISAENALEELIKLNLQRASE